MEYKIKRISTAGIDEAIAKAELYRSLNEPEEAESICRDILAIEPQHQFALRLLGLALTDQFTGRGSDRYRETRTDLPAAPEPVRAALLHGDSARATRESTAQCRAAASVSVLALFDQALHSFAEAENIRPAGNDDAILRWNRCVRLLQNPAYGWDELEPELVPFDAQTLRQDSKPHD